MNEQNKSDRKRKMELEELYKEVQPRIYAFFFIKTSSKEIAEDLTQEVFYEALKSMHTFSQQSTIQTWLFSIAKNRLLKHYRSKKYKNQLNELLKKEAGELPNFPLAITVLA